MASGGTYRNPWRAISEGYPLFLQCCRFVVGRGDRIRFWEDHWVSDGVFRDMFPRLFRLSRKQSMCIASVQAAGTDSVNWDLDFRRSLNDAEALEVARLTDLLGRESLVESRMDTRRWEKDNSGLFTCKSYAIFLRQGATQEDFPPFAQIWKAKVPPKVKVLVWLVALRKVNTGDTLQLKRPYMCLSPYWCILCKGNLETVDHLFLHCPFSSRVWWKLLRELQVSWATPKGCYELLCIKVDIQGQKKRARIIWGCLVHAIFWNIWTERNRRIFSQSVELNPEEVWDRVKAGASLWASVTAQFKDYHFGNILTDLRAVLV